STPSSYTLSLHDALPIFELCTYVTLRSVPRQAIEKNGDRWLMVHPVPCSGPYELAAWRVNDRIRLRKNPRYWDAANTKTEIVDRSEERRVGKESKYRMAP